MRKILMSISVLAIVALALATRVTAGEKGSGVKPGDMAPQFALQDQDGKTVNLADSKGKIVVLEWFNNECPFVQRHYKANTMKNTVKGFDVNKVVWLAVDSTSGNGAPAGVAVTASAAGCCASSVAEPRQSTAVTANRRAAPSHPPRCSCTRMIVRGRDAVGRRTAVPGLRGTPRRAGMPRLRFRGVRVPEALDQDDRQRQRPQA